MPVMSEAPVELPFTLHGLSWAPLLAPQVRYKGDHPVRLCNGFGHGAAGCTGPLRKPDELRLLGPHPASTGARPKIVRPVLFGDLTFGLGRPKEQPLAQLQ